MYIEWHCHLQNQFPPTPHPILIPKKALLRFKILNSNFNFPRQSLPKTGELVAGTQLKEIFTHSDWQKINDKVFQISSLDTSLWINGQVDCLNNMVCDGGYGQYYW